MQRLKPSIEQGWVGHVFTHHTLSLSQVVLGGADAILAAQVKAFRLLPPNMQRRAEALRRMPGAEPSSRYSLRLRACTQRAGGGLVQAVKLTVGVHDTSLNASSVTAAGGEIQKSGRNSGHVEVV